MDNLDNTYTLPTGIMTITKSMLDDIREQKQIKHVIIPLGVTSIEEGAFEDCKNLTSITIPDSVTIIGNGAFNGCKSLTSITIPDSVTEIGRYAFEDCSSLTSITIPDSIIKIGVGAFLSCSSLTSITIPESITYIGKYTFSGCTSLTSITIPNSVTTIREHAFHNCSSLTSIIIPDSVTTIREGAFAQCSSLTSITIPNNVTWISEGAFNLEKTTLITHDQLSTWASSQKLSGTYSYHELAVLYQLQKDDNFTPSWPELGTLTPNLLMDDLLEVLPKAKRNIVLPKTYINQPDSVCLENHSLFSVTPAKSRQKDELEADQLKKDGFKDYKNPDDPTKTIQLKEVSPAATSSILQWVTVKEVATLLNVKASSELRPTLI